MLPDRRFVRFFVVGLLNTLFGYSVFAMLVFSGVAYAIALFVATCIGAFFNFVTTGRLVFRNRDGSLLPRFIAAYMLVYVFNLGMLAVMVARGVDTYLAGAISTLCSVLVSYGLNSRLVFVERK